MPKPASLKSDRSAPTKPAKASPAPVSEGDVRGVGNATYPTFTLASDGKTDSLPESEWLLTNGLGGFAMGTAAGVPTRRYHGLLIAAMRPPVGRVMALNATVDRLIVEPDTPRALAIDLSGFRFAGLGDKVHPDGPKRIDSFVKDQSAMWVCRTPAATVTRRVHLHRGRNAVSISFTIERAAAAKGPVRLTCRPLVSLRDFHGLIRREWADRFSVRDVSTNGVTVERDGQSVNLHTNGGQFEQAAQWWNDFLYIEDRSRGQDCVEDLFSPGEFSIDLPSGQGRAELLIHAAVGEDRELSGQDVEEDRTERSRRVAALAAKIAGTAIPSPELTALAAASDDFVVARGTSRDTGTSVIAGYPWFSDWGRDTFVSLPGLLIATGRLDEAKQTLRVFASHRQRGLIPNVFNEQSGEPEYNTVDGSLWFIHAACMFAEAGGDPEFWRRELAPACLDVILHYRRGTDHNIAMDPFDKLITAGTSATQLTWMDARRDGVTFTPRYGKAVEINALWISGLKRVAALLSGADSQNAANLNDLAEAASRSFRKCFWNDAAACCFDCLVPSESDSGPVTWKPDASIRPNQVFAVSLPHSPLTPEQQRAVVRVVQDRLYTPRGVRTLDPSDSRYRGRYEGSLFERDGAYHNGTAWPWLLGPLAEATMRSESFSEASKLAARRLLAPSLGTLNGHNHEPGACLAQIAEIYDGDAPQRPQGCVAQAWSVAELLRVSILAR